MIISKFPLRSDFESMMNYGFILDFGMLILDLSYSVCFKWIERSDTADPKSEI